MLGLVVLRSSDRPTRQVIPMLGSDTFIGTRFVSVNGLHLPANQAIAYARGCCTPLWARNRDPAFPFSFRGSAFLHKRHGKHYVIFTHHQTMGWNMDDMCVSLRRDSRIMQSGKTYIGYIGGAQLHERHDLCAMILADDAVQRNLERGTIFYEPLRAPSSKEADQEIFSALGYPHALSDLTCSDKIEAHDLSQVRVDGTWIPPKNTDDLHGLHVNIGPIMRERCNGDFCGFSGGPVFSIHARRKAFEFRGIIIRGKGPLFFAPAPWVDALCAG